MHRKATITALSALALVAASGSLLVAGPLTPPGGPVASSYKTLSEVEPRIAINATTTPGDVDSLFKITAPGSYYLTGNITGVAGKHGIEIAAVGVTVDLNGFDLFGGAGSLSGVTTTQTGLANITVRNGSVRSWGSSGVDVSASSPVACRVENVQASVNANMGIAVGSGSTISDCSAYDNGSHGVVCGQGGTISACASRDNGFLGFNVGGGSTITACSANSNGTDGILTGSRVTVTNCTAASNALNGIEVASGCTVSQCTVGANVQNGIAATFSSSIINNACFANGSGGDGAGINISGTDNRIEGNTCSNADRGIDVDGPNNIIIRNTCRANTVNWTIVAGNAYGPIVITPAGAAVNGNNAAAALNSTDPNANFTY